MNVTLFLFDKAVGDSLFHVDFLLKKREETVTFLLEKETVMYQFINANDIAISREIYQGKRKPWKMAAFDDFRKSLSGYVICIFHQRPS